MIEALLFAATVGGGAPAPSGALLAAAAASGRPRECTSSAGRALSRGPSIWEIARVPTLQRYCDLVARAHVELATDPAAAKRSAEEADKALPGRASPQVLLGRAALALGDPAEAAKAFERAQAVDPRSLEDPAAMHDRARALQKTGKRDEALAIYRALVPRIDLLPTNERRIGVLLEAAHVSMASEAQKPAAQARADEAIAYLREARQRPPSQLAGDVLLSLALALDRGGEKAQAESALGEAERTAIRVREAPEYLAVPEDKAALQALSSEGGDRAGAVKAWEAYLAGPGGKGAWAAAARARLELVRRSGGRDAARKAPPKKGRR